MSSAIFFFVLTSPTVVSRFHCPWSSAQRNFLLVEWPMLTFIPGQVTFHSTLGAATGQVLSDLSVSVGRWVPPYVFIPPFLFWGKPMPSQVAPLHDNFCVNGFHLSQVTLYHAISQSRCLTQKFTPIIKRKQTVAAATCCELCRFDQVINFFWICCRPFGFQLPQLAIASDQVPKSNHASQVQCLFCFREF